MALQVSKDIENLAKAAEEKRKLEEQGIGMTEAGLGLGGAAFAAQTGRTPAPAPAPKLSPFAQQVAAADKARMAQGATTSTQATTRAAQGSAQITPAITRAASLYPSAIQTAQLMRGAGGSMAVPLAMGAGDVFGVGEQDPEVLARAAAEQQAQRTAQGDYVRGMENLQTMASLQQPTAMTAALPDMSQSTQEARGERLVTRDGVTSFDGAEFFRDVTPEEAAQIEARNAQFQAQAPEPREELIQFKVGDDMVGAGEAIASFMRGLDPASGYGTPTDTAALDRAEAMAPPIPTGAALTEGVTEAAQAGVSTAQQNFLARQQQGTPLTAQEIASAKRYATSQGQIFDPEAGYAPAEFYGQQYVGQSIGDYLRAVDEPTQKAEAARTAFERESAAREARIEARPDFMEAQPSQRTKDVGQLGIKYSDNELRRMVGGGDALKRAKALQDAGRDPLTGQPVGMTEYQKATLEQNQQRIDFNKEQADEARKIAIAKGATQAQKDAFELKQKELNYAMTYQEFLKDQEAPAFDAKDIEADLEGIEDQLGIVYDPEAGVFRQGKTFGKGAVVRLDDPKNASIVRTIGTYKVGKALLDKYPTKG